MQSHRYNRTDDPSSGGLTAAGLARRALLAMAFHALVLPAGEARAQYSPAAALEGTGRPSLMEVLESIGSGSTTGAEEPPDFAPLSRLGRPGSVPGGTPVTTPPATRSRLDGSPLRSRSGSPVFTPASPSVGAVLPVTSTTSREPGEPARPPVDPRTKLQQQIAAVATSVAGRRFPYDPATNGGAYGCAQVVSTILRRAGSFPRITLDAYDLRDSLLSRGWFKTRKDQYMDGDVVFWSTYDWDRDGYRDPDTHVGVVVMRGNTPYVVQNSTSMRMPVMVPLHSLSWPITNSLRMKP